MLSIRCERVAARWRHCGRPSGESGTSQPDHAILDPEWCSGGRLVPMIDDPAKEYLHGDFREVRETMLYKLEGVAEYDARRPLTYTGTNSPRLDQAPVDHRGLVFRRGVRGARSQNDSPGGTKTPTAAPTCGPLRTSRASISSTATGAYGNTRT